MTAHNPFKYFKKSHEIIRLAVMYLVRYPLSFRQVEDILPNSLIKIRHMKDKLEMTQSVEAKLV